MNTKIIGILCILLILSLPISFAQRSESVVEDSTGIGEEGVFVSSAFDSDGDDVCDEPRSHYREEGVDTRYADCTFTTRGDLCDGTPVDETAYKDGDRSGCSDSQLIGYHNYWSIHLGEMRPKTVKPNWLIDQRQGIRVYQPIELVKNPEYLSEDESIQFKSISLQCDNGRGVVLTEALEGYYEIPDYDLDVDEGSTSGAVSVSTEREGVLYIEGDYGRVSEADLDSSDLNVDLEVFLKQQDEALVRPKEFIEGVGDTDLLENLQDQAGIDEIEFNCRVTIHQCREQFEETDEGTRVKGCSTIYPPEVDELIIRVPLDTLAIRAPDEMLDAGISTADFVIDKTEWILPHLKDAFERVNSLCWRAVLYVIGGKVFSFIPGLNTAADFIWFGPEGLREYGLFYEGSFILSGRSACAATVCPREWCGLLNRRAPGSEKTFGELAVRKDPKTEEDVEVPIQSSLLLSAGCGCVSGLYSRVNYLKAMAMNWKICLLQARNAGEWVGNCDRYLKEGICTFVLEEMESLKDYSVIGALFPGSKEGEEGRADAATEATATNLLRHSADTIRTRTGDFYQDELSTLGRGKAGAALGYGDNLLFQTLCSYSIYRELPDFNAFAAHDLDKISMESTRTSNFEYKVAYLGEGGRPVYSYRVSWMVVAGKENMRYKVYLENDLGTPRQLHEGILDSIGDFASDFVEITDDLEYTQLCIEIPKEARRIVCFPPGGGSEGGLIEELDLFRAGDINDRDNDRLPDEWEERWSCDVSRTSFVEDEDREDCRELLSVHGERNLLNPDSADSDGDRIEDRSEDPDNDGYNNYQEYVTNGRPNKAGETIEGGVMQTKCRAEFGDMSIKGGVDILRIKSVERRFVPGETISLHLTGLRVLEDKSISPAEDILVKTVIKGPDLFSTAPSEITFNDALNREFVVWNIPTGRGAPSTGIYDVTVQLVVPNVLREDDVCRDDKNILTEKTKKILIYNSQESGCVDSDEGANYEIGGVCVDQTDVHSDYCNEGNAVDFFCRGGRCEAGTRSCGTGGICEEGKCSTTCFDDDPLNYVGFPGICKDARGEHPDVCNERETRVAEFYCGASGTCESTIKPCSDANIPSCVTDSFVKTLPEADIDGDSFEIAICE